MPKCKNSKFGNLNFVTLNILRIKQLFGEEKESMSKRARQRKNQSKISSQYIVIGVIAVAIIGAAVAFAATQSGDDRIQSFGSEGNLHFGANETPSAYIWRTHPPTSGKHGNTVGWGIYEETVPEVNQIHNLEDGGVIIHYNCPEECPEIVAELSQIVSEMGTEQLILHPYTNMDSKIALTAWTKMLQLDEVDRDAIIDFIKKYRGIDHHSPGGS